MACDALEFASQTGFRLFKPETGLHILDRAGFQRSLPSNQSVMSTTA